MENEKGLFNGNGYFVVEDFTSGEKLLKMEGEKYDGRDVHFNVADAEEFLLDPVQANELYPDF